MTPQQPSASDRGTLKFNSPAFSNFCEGRSVVCVLLLLLKGHQH